jgi:hypothetical protein
VTADHLTDIDIMKLMKSRRIRQSVLAGVALVVAFVFMASIFAPDRTQAGDESARPMPAPAPHSAEAIENSLSLGDLEGPDYSVQIYATPNGPLYSVLDSKGREVATMLTPTQVAQQFPGVPLPGAHANVPLTVMGSDIGGSNP